MRAAFALVPYFRTGDDLLGESATVAKRIGRQERNLIDHMWGQAHPSQTVICPCNTHISLSSTGVNGPRLVHNTCNSGRLA